MLERLAAAAAGLLEEGSADARAAGRRLIWRLARLAGGHEGFARLLARTPADAERKRRALEALDAALIPEGFSHATPAGASAFYGPDGLFLGQASGTSEAGFPQAGGTPDRGRRRSAASVPAQPAQREGPLPHEPLAYPGTRAEVQHLDSWPARTAAAAAPEGAPGGRVAAAQHAAPMLQGYAAAYAAWRPRRSSGDSESSGSAEPPPGQALGRA